ncbi:MAG: DUF885 domain-containing protein [Eubacteriales bacterium]|nr:DUF885 domain-containing protein [Eubacteriales bacterium]
MEIRREFRTELDGYYNRIHINDFSSFIKSDFRDGQLFDLSEERAEQNIQESQDMIRSIDSWLDLPDITWEEQVILKICRDFCEYIIRNGRYYWYKFNLTHNTTPLPYVVKRLETYPLEGKEDLERYESLLAQFPGKLEEMMQKLKEQEKRGILLPDEQVEILIRLLESLRCPPDTLLKPWNRKHVRLAISEASRKRIEEVIVKFNNTLEWMMQEIRHHYNSAGEVILPGLCHINGGEEYYRKQIITYTSYPLEPENLHELGMENLRITQEKMRAVIREIDLDCDWKEFQGYLRKNRICFDDTPEALQNRFDEVQRRIEPKLDGFFLRKPKAGCRCQALPKSKEGTMSWGYYSVPIGEEKDGIFYYSAAELDKRSQIRTAAIVAHELLPGHHFQTNLIAEDASLPLICREHFNTAYADGWAEYSADLVGEMGVYNPYELYGRYVWDLVLCCRLVVDTGLNAMGWSMEKARRFMGENTNLTESEIFMETLRYSVDMPAQALAYKYGSLKMHEFRDRARKGTGDRFDIKSYHEEVLRYGSAPLNILETIINNYILTNK